MNDKKEKLNAAATAGEQKQSVSKGLAVAVWHDQTERIASFLGKGAAPDEINDFGLPNLMQAAKNGSEAAVRMLLDAGADPNLTATVDVHHRSVRGWTALMFAAADKNGGGLTRMLLAAGANPGAATEPEETGESWFTPLVAAAEKGNEEAARALLGAGANPDTKFSMDDWGRVRTVLMTAAETGGAGVTRALLEAGADHGALWVGDDGKDGWTALMLAASSGDAAAVTVLLDFGADPEARCGAKGNDKGKTALMLAAEKGNTAAARALLVGGAAPDATGGADCSTALMLASAEEVSEGVRRELLRRGADRRAVNSRGKTAADLAEENNLPTEEHVTHGPGGATQEAVAMEMLAELLGRRPGAAEREMMADFMARAGTATEDEARVLHEAVRLKTEVSWADAARETAPWTTGMALSCARLLDSRFGPMARGGPGAGMKRGPG